MGKSRVPRYKKPLPLANPVPDRFDLIPWGAVCQVARTMTDSLKDHDEGGWRKLSRRDHVSRVLRHLALYLSGDTSEAHLEHAACRMLMALDIEENETEVEPFYEPMFFSCEHDCFCTPRERASGGHALGCRKRNKGKK